MIAAAPVQASTLTLGVERITYTEVTFLAGPMGGITLPDSTTVVKNATASITVPDNPAWLIDGDIELTYDIINDVLDDYSYGNTVQSWPSGWGFISDQLIQYDNDSVIIRELSGTGWLTPDSPNLNRSPFDFTYQNETNSIFVDGYVPEVALSCLSVGCDIIVEAESIISLDFDGLLAVLDNLLVNPDVSPTPDFVNFLSNLQQTAAALQLLDSSFELYPFLGVDFDAVDVRISAAAELSVANSNSSTVDADVTGAATATSTEPEQLFSTAYVEESTPEAESIADSSITLGSGPINLLPSANISPEFPLGEITLEPGLITSLNSSVSEDSYSENDDNNAQDVPEPSMVIGFLGTAALFARQRSKQTATR